MGHVLHALQVALFAIQQTLVQHVQKVFICPMEHVRHAIKIVLCVLTLIVATRVMQDFIRQHKNVSLVPSPARDVKILIHVAAVSQVFI